MERWRGLVRFSPWAISASVALAQCAGTSPTTDAGAGFEVVRSTHSRVTVDAPAEDVAAVVHGTTGFALDLLRAAAPAGTNTVMSPYSASIPLAMTYAGARGDTGTQMASALHFTLPQARLHAAIDTLDRDLTTRTARAAATTASRPMQLRVVNAVWAQRGYTFLGSFLDGLAENYGAGVQTLDFVSQPEASRAVINRWVGDQTHGRIPSLVGDGAITSATTMVLSNAVYFLAGWNTPFDRSRTASAAFQRLDGSTATAPAMREQAEMGYAEGPGWHAVDIRYQGDQSSMLVIVPDAGTFADFERGLSAERFEAIVTALAPYRVTLTLPRFSVRRNVSLETALRALGMVDAFTPGTADLSGIDGSRRLYVQHVVHEGSDLLPSPRAAPSFPAQSNRATVLIAGNSVFAPGVDEVWKSLRNCSPATASAR